MSFNCERRPKLDNQSDSIATKVEDREFLIGWHPSNNNKLSVWHYLSIWINLTWTGTFSLLLSFLYKMMSKRRMFQWFSFWNTKRKVKFSVSTHCLSALITDKWDNFLYSTYPQMIPAVFISRHHGGTLPLQLCTVTGAFRWWPSQQSRIISGWTQLFV